MPEEDRRKPPSGDQSAAVGELNQLPVLVVLERLCVPVLAVCSKGRILFANTAFADMVGQPLEVAQCLNFDDIFHAPSLDLTPLPSMQACAGEIVELLHADGSTVRARMSTSALRRDGDNVALVTFDNLTGEL